MAPDFSVNDYVVCDADNGYAIEDNQQSQIVTHFRQYSVGMVREIFGTSSRVYLIGEDADYCLLTDTLTCIDPTKTGKDYPKKICNLCHCLKVHSEFSPNQTDSHGKTISRPSCRICRRDIDRKPMTLAAKREAKEAASQEGVTV